jgi:inhibitor of cysteine peptidase
MIAVVITLTQADNGRRVEARLGDTITIRLDENPTTGYRWSVEEEGGGVFNIAGTEFIQSADAKIGGGGQRVLTLRAAQAGAAPLKIKLWRQWEGDRSIKSRFSVDIQVSG